MLTHRNNERKREKGKKIPKIAWAFMPRNNKREKIHAVHGVLKPLVLKRER